MLDYATTMTLGQAQYQVVLDLLAAAGLAGTFTQTGGMNAALEVVLDGGHTLLITDGEDALPWNRVEHRGWAVGLYPPDRANTDGQCVTFDSTEDGGGVGAPAAGRVRAERLPPAGPLTATGPARVLLIANRRGPRTPWRRGGEFNGPSCHARGGGRPPCGAWTTSASWTLSAATSGGSCSHTRRTCQPALSSIWSVSRSRCTLRSSFSCHQSALFLGDVPCSGQRCQKHPSTNTARRALVNTTSARRRTPGNGARSTRYRSPRACSSRRSANSGAVSRERCRRNRLRTASELGARAEEAADAAGGFT